MSNITPIVMPKWGLSMQEGTVTSWLVEVGTQIEVGMPILEVETDKIANAVEAPDPGLLRRKVASDGELLPVKALLGVMADSDVTDAEIDEYIASYVTPSSDDDGVEEVSANLFVDVNGINVRYVKRGADSGVPVIFIHGFGGDLDNWLFNIDSIADKHPVIALDLPGHGQSAIKLPGASITALGNFVIDFMKAINVDKAHLVGHSMGGAVAAKVALLDSNRVDTLNLICTAGMGEDINSSYTHGFASSESKRELKPFLELLFADSSLVGRQMIDDVLKYKRLDGVTNLLLELGGALFGNGKQCEQPVKELSGNHKVLIIVGEKDQIIPSQHVKNAPSHAKVQVFSDAGHMTQMEKANEVNKLIIDHISG
jgi:pyruvate dehydrogenase E2 component (dihydrolipoamide acetyltransferase)